MKEKRCFGDLYFGYYRIIVPSIFIMYWLIILIVSHSVILSYYGDALNSYSLQKYEYLDDISDSIINEGVGIDISSFPDDVDYYRIIKSNSEVTITYRLNTNSGWTFAQPAIMTIRLDDDFTIISKEPNYSNKEEYVKDVELALWYFSIICSFILSALSWAITLFIGSALANISISRSRKAKHLS